MDFKTISVTGIASCYDKFVFKYSTFPNFKLSQCVYDQPWKSILLDFMKFC